MGNMYPSTLTLNWLFRKPNAAPEWQAESLAACTGVIGGLSTLGACWTKPLRGRFKATIAYFAQYA